jgi:hypothetical protein
MTSGSERAVIGDNAKKSLKLASLLFPEEEWIPKERNIYVAKSRLAEEYKEPDKWEREMSQVRILTVRGSAAYFLPEVEQKGQRGRMNADLVLDGVVMEMKTVSGTRKTLGTQFKYGYKQGAYLTKVFPDIEGHSVFIRLLSDLEVDSVRAKIAGELKNRSGPGQFTCYFEHIGKLYTWTYDELRGIIGR